MKQELINQLIESELKEVDAKWPDYHSHHEAFAVIKEEAEELNEVSLDAIAQIRRNIWGNIRKNTPEKIRYYELKNIAHKALKESVQLYVTALRAERLTD